MDAKWAFDLQTSFLIYSVTAMPTDYWVQYPGALSRDQLREQGQPETPVDAQHVGEWQTAEDTTLPVLSAPERSSSEPWQLPSQQEGFSSSGHVRDLPASPHGATFNANSLSTVLEGGQLVGPGDVRNWTDAYYSSGMLSPTLGLDTPLSSPGIPGTASGSSADAHEWNYHAAGPPAGVPLDQYDNSLAYALVEAPRFARRERSRSMGSVSQGYSDDTGSHAGDDSRTEPPSPPTARKVANRRRPRAKIYPCPSCDKWFDRPSALGTHQNAHTGEQPYPCHVPGCDRRFSVQSNARRHALTHEKPKPRPVTIAFEAPVVASPSPLADVPGMDVKWAEADEP